MAILLHATFTIVCIALYSSETNPTFGLVAMFCIGWCAAHLFQSVVSAVVESRR
jgi:hypothetical protein